MGRVKTFSEFLAGQSTQVPVWGFVVNLLVTALLAYLLSILYAKYGRSLSNRERFADNFVLIAVTTMIIITIVKSSLALSLGLVGALSIVRFRAAIKEPEELSYLFINISIGLGLGANQRVVSVLGFAFIAAVIIGLNLRKRSTDKQNLQLTIYSEDPQQLSIATIVANLEKYCLSVDMKRLDENQKILEAAFRVELKDMDHLVELKSALQKISETCKITFLDNKGLT